MSNNWCSVECELRGNDVVNSKKNVPLTVINCTRYRVRSENQSLPPIKYLKLWRKLSNFVSIIVHA